MPSTSPNPVEVAEWEIIGEPRLSDAAIHALVLLGFDLVEAEEAEADENHQQQNQ